MTPIPIYSIILPCYNEVGNLVPLIEEIRGVMEKIGKPFEVIYVDDCRDRKSVV